MSELGRLARAVRRTVRVRERTLLVGSIYYRCSRCEMAMRFLLARGVALPSRVGRSDRRAVVPSSVSCGYCDGQMIIQEDTYEELASGPTVDLPYLRVPSRRSEIKESGGAIEAQIVWPT